MKLPRPAKFICKISIGLVCYLFSLFLPLRVLAATFDIPPTNTTALINAINEATSSGSPSVINLSTNSEYKLTEKFSSSYSDNGFPLITSEITINGNGSKIYRDTSSPRFRIFAIEAPGKLALNNITLSKGESVDVINGSSDPNDLSDYYGGGAILNFNGTLELNDAIITENTVYVGGGAGIWAGNGSSTKIYDSTISNNIGGGLNPNLSISSGGAFTKRGSGSFEVYNSIITNNYAETIGGAIYSVSTGLITLKNVYLTNNSVTIRSGATGGGIYNYSGKINIENSCITGNSPNAIKNDDYSNTISATQNWWGATNGPSGVGPGSGDSVSSNVDYSNWLASCPPLTSPSPSPEVSPSPIPSPSPSLIPIVLLPGMGGSWNTTDLITGNSGGIWKKTPFIKVYDNLKNTLANAGYSENQNYFEFYYDWRQPIGSLADQLNDFINNKFEAGTKINLVGHSLGGLVSRAYGQKYGGSKINKIITAGSPHEGAIPAYLAWNGAEISGESWEQLGLDLYLHLHQGQFNSPVTAIQNLDPGLKDLLPIFDFAKRTDNTIIPVDSLAAKNDYLIGLKSGLIPELSALMLTIAGVDQETTEWLKIGDRTLADKLLNRWADGRPISNESTVLGDGTVLKKSTLLMPELNQTTVVNSHRDLVQTQTGIEAILADLNIAVVPQIGDSQPPRNPGLFFLLHSPAEITVTAPDNGQAGFNVSNPIPNSFYSPEDKLLIIYQALAGDYRVNISGTGAGEYQLDIGQLTDQGESWSSLVDTIQPGAVDNLTVSFNPIQPLTDPVVDPTGADKISQAKLRLEQLKTKTDDRRLIKYLDQIIRLLDKNKLASVKLALTSTYKFRYWVDRFAQSDPYLKSEADQIGQLLNQSLVTLGQNSRQKLTKNGVRGQLNSAQRTKNQLEKRAGKIDGENLVLGNTLELINHYLELAQTAFDTNNFWPAHANVLVVRVLTIEANALIK